MHSLSNTVFAYSVNALWAALLALVTEAISRVLRGVRAAVNHGIWITCPCLALVLPGISLFHASDTGTTGASQGMARKLHPGALGTSPVASAPLATLARQGFSATEMQAIRGREVRVTRIPFLPESICVFYMLSVLLAFCRLWRSLMRTRTLLRRAARVALTSPVWSSWAKCLDTFHLDQVRLASSKELKAQLLLPGSALLFSCQQIYIGPPSKTWQRHLAMNSHTFGVQIFCLICCTRRLGHGSSSIPRRIGSCVESERRAS